VTEAILTLNAGSSSLKFAVFRLAAGTQVLLAGGQIADIGTSPRMIAKDASGGAVAEQHWSDAADRPPEAFVGGVMNWTEAYLGGDQLAAVGHRVVHGGTQFAAPVRVTERALQALDALCPLAPLHQPHNLAVIRAVQRIRPALPQVAAFDTAFHHGHAPVIDRFGLPREWEGRGLRRYGFHGLSYEYVAGRLLAVDAAAAAGRAIVCHLGAGASLCALKEGRSIDTTMGFSTLDGLVMGTRCGSIDPGVLLYLLQEQGLNAAELSELLYRQSGLLGVSGLTSDMRALLASADPAAREAIELFVFRTAREAAALAGTLGGLDALVFTAGIGENAPEIRAQVCERLAWLGVMLDPQANRRGKERISAPESAVSVWVIPTDEEQMIARHTQAALAGTVS
jgi:acetate kinase